MSASRKNRGPRAILGEECRLCLELIVLRADVILMAHTMSPVPSLESWKAGIVLDVVDKSIESARSARARSEAARAQREAEEARARAEAEESRRRREQIEADDARKISDEQSASARAARRRAIIEAMGQ
ncbi:MAG: hypothetical protein JNK25_10820 [Phycisphaerae bacterium]|nr:hypothetical protein [Phycisphaerae bacterium]